MYSIVIWLAVFANGFDEVYPIYNQNLLFQDKQTCDKYIKDNYSNITLQIKKAFQSYQSQIELKEIITMKCITVGEQS